MTRLTALRGSRVNIMTSYKSVAGRDAGKIYLSDSELFKSARDHNGIIIGALTSHRNVTGFINAFSINLIHSFVVSNAAVSLFRLSEFLAIGKRIV